MTSKEPTFREVSLLSLWRSLNKDVEPPPGIDDGSIRSWECVLDDEVLGHCTGDIRTGRIISLTVQAGHEGKGIGTKLLSLVTEWLRGSGAATIWLEGPSDTSLRAHRFYCLQGWIPTGKKLSEHTEAFELTLRRPR